MVPRQIRHILKYWVYPVFPLDRVISAPRQYARFWSDYSVYRDLPGAEAISKRHMLPMLYDRTSTTGFDSHYFYQGIWLFQKVQEVIPSLHIDVGSLLQYSGFLSQITHVTFLDIRPAAVDLPQFTSMNASILQLPFASNSVNSISCLHVAEHIGLGRYGDPLDPLGTKKSAAELSRVLSDNGDLYFSVPIGKSRVQFNAHRILSPDQVLEYFSGLYLVDFSAIDQGQYFTEADPADFCDSTYACGLFHFRKTQ